MMGTHLLIRILPEITEKGLQDCIKVGLSADLSYAGVGSGSAHIKPEHCNTLKDSNTGLSFPVTSFTLFLIPAV